MLVGLAGPAANFVLALVSVVALRIAYPPADLTFDVDFTSPRLLDTLVAVNVILGVFNLLPIPPLDGSTLLSILLPPSRQNILRFLDQYGIFLLLALLILAPNLLSPDLPGHHRGDLRSGRPLGQLRASTGRQGDE